jgi:putative tryptophan/tyrosine transport system substrate-binding protein
MDRRRFLLTSLAGALTGPLAANSQQTPKVYRVGVLAIAGSFSSQGYQGFREQLRLLGYVEGRTLVFDFRSTERPEELPSLAEEIIRANPDVIVAPATAAAQAVQRVSRTIPIVFAFAADPVAAGLAASLARPGGSATGLSILNTELSGKRLELVKEILPSLTRVAVLWALPEDPAPGGPLLAGMRETEAGARRLGLTLDLIKIKEASELDRAFSTIASRQHQALIVLPTPVSNANFGRIADLAVKTRLAGVAENRQFADAGGLMAYGANYADQLRRAATYVDKILKGVKPGDLPVEQPTKFELVINLKTAKALGLTIPPSLRARADQVIE